MTTSAKSRKYAKVTISLPADLLQAVDQRQQERGESRSEVVRHAIEELFRQERERALEEQYIRGYREHPVDEDESRAMDQLTTESATWDEWEEKNETGRSVVGAA